MRKLKTILITALAAISLAGCKPTTTAPNTTSSTDTIEPAPHTHDYGEGVVTKEATCTEDGVKTFTCECGDTYTEVIPATGHSYDEGVVTTPATATQYGEKTYTCGTCGDVYTEPVAYTGDVIPVGLANISSVLVMNLTRDTTYTPDYMYENFVNYDESDGTYWTGLSFGTSITTSDLADVVVTILGAYEYNTVLDMTEDDGWFYGFFVDAGVEDLYEDTVVYEVDCYSNSKGATVLQLIAAEATYFMSE